MPRHAKQVLSPLPQGRVTIKDIATAAGLSKGIVSMALRNRPGVRKTTCEFVNELARKMGYQPNPHAVGMAQLKRNSRTNSITASLAWLNSWEKPEELRKYKEFDLYWEGAQACAEKFGYRLDEFIVNDQQNQEKVRRILRARNTQGVLLAPGFLPTSWGSKEWQGFAAVHIGHIDSDVCPHIVASDQLANTMLAYDSIRDHGYKRVGFVGSSWRARLFGAGYLWAHFSDSDKYPLHPLHDLEDIPPLLLPDINLKARDENKKAFLAWVEKTRPDAILSDIALVRGWLEDAGYRIPDDIGLAATNVLDVGIPAGINQNPEETGRVAVLMLISLINDCAWGHPRIQRVVHIRGTWVDGDTLPKRP